MTNSYVTYGLSLLSALIGYWAFGVMATVSAGVTWVPVLGFCSSLLHFGLSSWLFLYLPKSGRILALITTVLLCVWPLYALFDAIKNSDSEAVPFYVVPLFLNGIVVYQHLSTYGIKSGPTDVVKLLMSVVPLSLVAAYCIYVLLLIKNNYSK